MGTSRCWLVSSNRVAKADLERFVANYRKAGGHIELELFDAEDEAFIHMKPDSPAAVRAIEKIREFVHEQAR